MSLPHARLAELFERLVALSSAEREAALLDLGPESRGQLERLLAADAQAVDPLAQAVGAGAESLVLPTPGGTRLGAYKVLHQIGAGGMGSVLLAERADGHYQQQVAIKLIRGFPTEEGKRRLRQERQILAQLDHPNIAHLLDGGESDDGQPFVVMEFIDGLPLLEHIARRAPESAITAGQALRARLALFDKIAAAVQHAHERLVIHRDIKPGNVLVRADGEPKLLDFGVAKLVDLSAASDPRQTSTRVWTPGYASPEQQSGGVVTTASDVFGLAILLRELLTGERDSGRLSSTPSGFRALALDAEVRGILVKASAPQPEQRYATVEALRADLRRWLEGRPVRAAPDTGAYRARKFVRRHRLAVALIALALLAAGGFVWRLAAERARAVQAEEATRTALAAAEREASNARAALAFLLDAIGAAVPERAMSAEVSVRDLLDHARAELEKRTRTDSALRQPMQRLLGQLFHSLGEPAIAVELLQAGLAGIQPEHAAAALPLADALDAYSSALGALERGAESMAVAERSAALRERFAPGDDEQRLRALDQLAFGRYRLGEYDAAERLWTEALALAATLPSPPIDVVTNSYQAFGSMLEFHGETARALALSEQAQSFVQRHVPAESPLRVNLLRLHADVLRSSGKPAEAERVVRDAIALQARSVGTAGMRMSALHNTLGTILNDLGRYREALDVLQRSAELGGVASDSPTEDAIALSNIASVAENAGDYPRALALFEQALARMEAQGGDPDDSARRMLERNYARSLAFAGRFDAARERLDHLRALARQIDGADSFEFATTTWQRVVLARRMRDPATGEGLLGEARVRFAALVPEAHPVFAHMHRAEASFAQMQGDPVRAERLQRQAVASLEAASVLPVDLAIARAELAGILRQIDRRKEADALLEQALPVLRDALLPPEVHRVAAEALATQP